MTAPVFILAGEPSGDQLAASIMDAVDAGFGKQLWFGVGGPLMQKRGLVNESDMTQLSVLGFGAALSAYPRLSAFANLLVNRIIETKPRAVITIDAKGFSLRLAKRLKKRMAAVGWSAPVIHVVAPTVWAWGAWRARSIAQAVDGLLCLFPFEPDYFTPHGLDAHFIGHPEAFNDELLPRSLDVVGDGTRRLLLLPGSRRSEIRRLLPVMRDAYVLLQVHGEFKASLMTVPLLRAEVEAILGRNSGIEICSTGDNFHRELYQADAMMAASGTVTLQTALAGVPGVACYRSSMLSALIGRWLVRMDRVILPNVLLQREIYPFSFQHAATPAGLAMQIQRIFSGVSDRRTPTDFHKIALANSDELRALLRGGSNDFETLVAEALAPYFAQRA